MPNKTKPKRLKKTFYTDPAPDVEEMLNRALSVGRNISQTTVLALRQWLAQNGFSDQQWTGKRFSKTKCP